MSRYMKIVKSMPQVYALNKAVYNNEGLLIDLILTETNDSFDKKLELQTKDLLNGSIDKWLFSSTIKEDFLNDILKVKNTGKYFEHKEIIKRNNRWFKLVAFWLEEENIVIMLEETTMYKEFHEYCQEEHGLTEARINNFFDNAPLSIIFYKVINGGETAFDYIIRRVNNDSLKTEGWVKEDVLGKSLGGVKTWY